MVIMKDLFAVYDHIYSYELLIFNHANSGIANINHSFSLGLTKTDYEMILNCAGHSTQSLSMRNFKGNFLAVRYLAQL